MNILTHFVTLNLFQGLYIRIDADPDVRIYRVDTNAKFFVAPMPRWHGTLERQSTQSALSIQQCAFTQGPFASKKQRHFVLCDQY
ncbi:hypothetical protein [Pedobacter miscanthi]|uniref:Uncharacterized protein n=1 Tax=Pedobacter miscanthi TaxID=2259170 RepID=A0A366KM12_9SPHI|nr:hypothetical protein [Pedobacter miscanthi]RBQ02737.1 hypothetical protein DRW42_25220 [Pedobacter miscanthi]